MGGEIGVDSDEGCGSTFWIRIALPAADAPDLSTSDAAPMGATAPARILLAEDIGINQELAHALLEAAGHEVDIVMNGTEAVSAVQAKRYDIVLMDIQMPVMDGLTATRRIRALEPPTSDVLIVAMTANVLPQQLESYRKAGMNDHIGKPVKRADLLAKLSHWLARDDETPDGLPMDHTQDPPGFSDRDFEDFRHTIGDERIQQWLRRLDEHLHETFDRKAWTMKREELGASAHAVVSQAALLGFSDLARLCAELDRACSNGDDFDALYSEARDAALTARAALASRLGADVGDFSSRSSCS